jgi:hypothetical protein
LALAIAARRSDRSMTFAGRMAAACSLVFIAGLLNGLLTMSIGGGGCACQYGGKRPRHISPCKAKGFLCTITPAKGGGSVRAL